MSNFKLNKSCRHIAFIMDGNGRWANKKLLPRHLGHKAGIERIIDITEACYDLGIECVTMYCFSTENWNRPKSEIDHLFKYFNSFFEKYAKKLLDKDIRIRVMGDISKLPPLIKSKLEDIIEKSKENKHLTLNLCLNYGGRQEIIRATQQIASEVKKGELDINNITPELFSNYLYSSSLPEVDLMIRTSGEVRISNYLLYQLAYAEFIFTPTYWPDFTKEKLYECLKEYESRDRRYGGIKK